VKCHARPPSLQEVWAKVKKNGGRHRARTHTRVGISA
jgi:hypothetical protein